MIKKIKFKNNNDEVFVTFHWVVDAFGNYVPIAIRCKDYENARKVASDVYSLMGVQFLYINKNGYLRLDTMLITSDDYLNNKCDFNILYEKYFDKYFKVH